MCRELHAAYLLRIGALRNEKTAVTILFFVHVPSTYCPQIYPQVSTSGRLLPGVSVDFEAASRWGKSVCLEIFGN
jgi:hypothetical protein